MNHPDLQDLDQRANRMLDGMTVNREKFARDVMAMTAELARWRDAHARSDPRPQAKAAGFEDAFGDLFGGRK